MFWNKRNRNNYREEVYLPVQIASCVFCAKKPCFRRTTGEGKFLQSRNFSNH